MWEAKACCQTLRPLAYIVNWYFCPQGRHVLSYYFLLSNQSQLNAFSSTPIQKWLFEHFLITFSEKRKPLSLMAWALLKWNSYVKVRKNTSSRLRWTAWWNLLSTLSTRTRRYVKWTRPSSMLINVCGDFCGEGQHSKWIGWNTVCIIPLVFHEGLDSDLFLQIQY